VPDSDALATRAADRAAPTALSPEGIHLVTEGNVFHQAWALSWPSALANLLQPVIFLTDALYVGRLNDPIALAALGTGQQLIWVMIAVGMALVVGTTALVARFVGAGEPANAARAARQSLLLALFSSIIIAVVLWVLRREILAIYRVPELVTPAADYLEPIIVSLPAYFGMLVVMGIFRGMGDVKKPLTIMAVATAVSVLGGYPMIAGTPAFSVGGLQVPAFAGLGLPGAGYTAAAGRLLACLVGLLLLRRTGLWRRFARVWRPSLHWFGRIANIGAPAALQQVSRSVGNIFFLSILGGSAGAEALAAFTVGVRIEGLSFMPGFASGVAATTMVGQNLGARQPDRAARSTWACAAQALIYMTAVGVVLFVLAEPIVWRFSHDAAILTDGVAYLRINALAFPLLALWMVLAGSLQGAGDTRFPALVTILSMWVVRIPLTYLLINGWGLGTVAAWWAMSASTGLGAILIWWRFRTGHWRYQTV